MRRLRISKIRMELQQKSKPRKNPMVKQTLETLYSQRDETGDVTFIVDSESIHAHRCVLAAISPKYKTQFYGSHPDNGEIHVKDASAAAFKEFLQFFYLEEIVLTMGNIGNVLNLAKQSLVDAFFTECIDFLTEMVTVDGVCTAYQMAILYDNKQLRDRCEQEISANTKKVFASDDFNSCDRDVLIQILQLDALDCNETEVFEACIAWAKTVCDQEGKNSADMQHLHTALFDVITQIRFSSVTAEEFAEIHNKYKGFFTADESSEVLYMIGKLKGFKSQRFNQTPRIQPKKPSHKVTIGSDPAPSLAPIPALASASALVSDLCFQCKSSLQHGMSHFCPTGFSFRYFCPQCKIPIHHGGYYSSSLSRYSYNYQQQ